jgi:hypothetical protein
MLRSASDEPRVAISIKESDDARRDKPQIDTVAPTRLKVRRDNEEPRLVEHKIEIDEPIRAKDLTDSEEPN